MCEDVIFFIERYQKIIHQPSKSGLKKKQIVSPLRTIRAAWIQVVFVGGMVVGWWCWPRFQELSVRMWAFSLKDIKNSTINLTKMAQKRNLARYLHRIDIPRGFGLPLGVKWAFVDWVIGNCCERKMKFSCLKKDCAVVLRVEGIWPIPSVHW